MNVHTLHQFVATTPGTFGQRISRRTAVDMIAQGSVDHAAALVGLAGLGTIPALVTADAPSEMIQAAIEYGAINHYRELPAFIAASGGRATFAAWCRQAGFTRPETLPETVDLYRGTMGCSPANAAEGLHWSFGFDHAAYYGCRFADAALTGVVVIHARVPREGIAAIVSGTAHEEILIAEVPTVFEVITDAERIADAAVRAARRYETLRTQGWSDNGDPGIGRRAAMATRARMAAGGVAPGTAIVA